MDQQNSNEKKILELNSQIQQCSAEIDMLNKQIELLKGQLNEERNKSAQAQQEKLDIQNKINIEV